MSSTTIKKFLQWLRLPGLNQERYWQQRAAEYGRRAVLNLGHAEEEFDQVTEHQWKELIPYLQPLLIGDEKLILDFGCGPGRFTAELARLIGGKAIGVDPISHFIELAPKHSFVEYRAMRDGEIPVSSESVDVVWICLVLGGVVKDRLLIKTLAEINRVLRKDGLLFLVENTTVKSNGGHWVFRSTDEYIDMFPFMKLVHLHDYFDLGERISIMAGRKFR